MRHTTTTQQPRTTHTQPHTQPQTATHTTPTHCTYPHNAHRVRANMSGPEDGELFQIRAHFRGVSWRYRRTNLSLLSAQQLVPSEVSLRIAEFPQSTPGTANDQEESAINVLFWTCSPTFKLHDPVVTTCKILVQVMTPRGRAELMIAVNFFSGTSNV